MRSVAVVGAGIVGLAVARRISEQWPGCRVTVLDKEPTVAAHQTGHNSGVVHAGLYYPPGSLKATLCARGRDLLRTYCLNRGLPYREVGKLVVAVEATELDGLAEIERRARANGVPGLRRLGPDGIREVEPAVVGAAALHSPRTAVTDFAAVARAFADDVRGEGGQVLLGTEVVGVRREPTGVRLRTRGDGAPAEHLVAEHVVLCGGLQTDRLARLAGDRAAPAIVAFRGEYLEVLAHRRDLVRGLVYPVPDPAYPFLGVHLTRRVDGGLDLGPNAVLALAREGYRWRDVDPADLAEVLRWPGFRALARRHWRTGLSEMAGSLSRRRFVERARRYVPSLSVDDVVPGVAGVRAQAVDADGTLVDDFRIHTLGRVTAVRNAPSPAATSSLAIAEHVVAAMRGAEGP
jgi:L-2-hydroxyglutarate oxidase LhgO